MFWRSPIPTSLGMHYRSIMRVTVATAASALLSVAIPLVFSAAIDRALTSNQLEPIVILSGALCCIAVADLALALFRSRTLRTYVDSEKRSRYRQMLDQYLSLSYPVIANGRVNRPFSYVSDIDGTIGYSIQDFSQTIADVFLLAAYVTALLAISPLLTAAVFVFIPVHVLEFVLIRQAERRFQGARTEASNRFHSDLEELPAQFESIRANFLNTQASRRIMAGVERLLDVTARRELKVSTVASCGIFLNRLSVAVLLGVGCALIVHDRLSVGGFFGFGLIYIRLSTPLLRVASFGGRQAAVRSTQERLSKLGDAAPKAISNGRMADLVDGSIRIDNLSFSYSEREAWALSGITANIENRTIVLLEGPSGAGKTTLARLLGRMLPASAGQIHIGGAPIEKIPEEVFRRNVAIVTQGDRLLRASINENLRCFSESVSQQEVLEICHALDLHSTISGHLRGYDAVIGEDIEFSVGQYKRLSIARALLRKPRILILDEPTAGLDAEAEAKVVECLRDASVDATIVIATHSAFLKTIATQHILLDHGAVQARKYEMGIEPNRRQCSLSD